jgi:hypothetical protein
MSVTARRWRLPGIGRAPFSNTLDLATGFYTPTLTNVANLSASTAARLRFKRLGDTVSVFGKVTVDPVCAGVLTRLGISLPIVSNFAAAEDCAGIAVMSDVAGDSAAIIGDATNDRMELNWVAGFPTQQTFSFLADYVVLG